MIEKVAGASLGPQLSSAKMSGSQKQLCLSVYLNAFFKHLSAHE